MVCCGWVVVGCLGCVRLKVCVCITVVVGAWNAEVAVVKVVDAGISFECIVILKAAQAVFWTSGCHLSTVNINLSGSLAGFYVAVVWMESIYWACDVNGFSYDLWLIWNLIIQVLRGTSCIGIFN